LNYLTYFLGLEDLDVVLVSAKNMGGLSYG
jgi:hypothetical protein